MRPVTTCTLVAVLSLAVGGALASASPQRGSYRQCTIANGQVTSCGPWHQGKAVVYRDKAYRQCTIANGQVTSCGPWYQGKAVVYRDKAYRQCTIANGQVTWCGPWYQGKAVVFRKGP